MMHKRINLQQMNALIKEVQSQIVTSNNIVPRVSFPYFHSHANIPKALEKFKLLLQVYRMASHDLLEEFNKFVKSDKTAKTVWNDFSQGAFARSFVGSLVVSSFGIGECAECSSMLAGELIKRGYGDLAFINVVFENSEKGMEQGHQFIIANLPKAPKRYDSPISIYDFFKELPKEAVIADAFLELCFTPDNIPNELKNYIDIYGGKAMVSECFHFYNLLPEKFLAYYLPIAKKIAGEMRVGLVSATPDYLSNKIKIDDTSLIILLKEKTKLSFFGLCDKDYKVDVLVELQTKAIRLAVFKLQDKFSDYGRFFCTSDNKKMFILEGVNIPDHEPNIGKCVRNNFLK